MGSPFVGPPVAKPKPLNCPNCGGAVELRGFAHTLSVVCPQCLSVLDASNPLVLILQEVQNVQQRFEMQIPLGTRGNLNGAVWEAIGFQVRQVASEDGTFSWAEYLLFNPYKGFRYLTEYRGHWNFVRVLAALPGLTRSHGKRAVEYQGQVYRHFDSGNAETIFVLGEFPWQVKVGERAAFSDYINPPAMLSSEEMATEVTWSHGDYWSGAQIWSAFQLPGRPYPAIGVFANQPSPFLERRRSAWRIWRLMALAWLALLILLSARAAREEVFRHKYSFTPGTPSAAPFVSEEFTLKGRAASVELQTNTDLKSDWAYFHYALINQNTGKAIDFGREISNYPDEGSPRDSVLLPAIPPGQYYLRVEPEKPAGGTPVNYEVVIRRDVPDMRWSLIAFALLLIPPVFTTLRSLSFESARWRESDYAS